MGVTPRSTGGALASSVRCGQRLWSYKTGPAGSQHPQSYLQLPHHSHTRHLTGAKRSRDTGDGGEEKEQEEGVSSSRGEDTGGKPGGKSMKVVI